MIIQDRNEIANRLSDYEDDLKAQINSLSSMLDSLESLATCIKSLDLKKSETEKCLEGVGLAQFEIDTILEEIDCLSNDLLSFKLSIDDGVANDFEVEEIRDSKFSYTEHAETLSLRVRELLREVSSVISRRMFDVPAVSELSVHARKISVHSADVGMKMGTLQAIQSELANYSKEPTSA